jgi:tetratricopeptide (TPR) repeat protein
MIRRLAVIGLGLAMAACATETTVSRPTPAPAPPPPTVQAPPSGPSPRALLAAPHRDRALSLERDGSLRRALDEWKIARTIDPDDATAREAQTRLEARIEGLVAQRIGEARAALARGSHVEAQRRLLVALALDPGNRTAMTMLQTEVHDVEFLVHTVRAGDTLGALAERYYGDRSRLEVIWETNQLAPNPRLVAGTTLKIPEIPGLPFARPTPRREATAPAPTPTPATPARPEAGREEAPPEINPLIAEAREALERREYVVALGDVDKLLNGDPAHREGLSLKKLVLYRQGKDLLDRKNYDGSYRTLTTLARLQPDYEDVPKLLLQMKGRLVEQHYREGIRLYREERLPQAIAEWRVVLDLEPQHANARKNIEQAERLLKGLEQRKRK